VKAAGKDTVKYEIFDNNSVPPNFIDPGEEKKGQAWMHLP
jgi:hypothetical protein